MAPSKRVRCARRVRAIPPSAKQTRTRTKRRRAIQQKRALRCCAPAHYLRLPVELLLLIINAVESQSTLAAATCVCQTFQDEAERLLYRKVSLHGANDVYAFSEALARKPRRASFVRSFEVKDDGRIAPAIPKLLSILPRLTHLTHLALYLDVCFEDATRSHDVLRTLNECTFSLQSYEGYATRDRALLPFLARQRNIELLSARTQPIGSPSGVVAGPGWVLPPDALPRLTCLATDFAFFATSVQHPHTRSITHLDLSLEPLLEDELFAVLRDVGSQLVSLKYERDHRIVGAGDEHQVDPPVDFFRVAALPRLKFLDVADRISSGVDLSCYVDTSSLAYMTNSNIALDTLVWRVTWLRRARRPSAQDRLAHVAGAGRLAKPLLQTCRPLRRVILQEYESGVASPAVAFSLPHSDSPLAQEEQSPECFPVWSDV